MQAKKCFECNVGINIGELTKAVMVNHMQRIKKACVFSKPLFQTLPCCNIWMSHNQNAQ